MEQKFIWVVPFIDLFRFQAYVFTSKRTSHLFQLIFNDQCLFAKLKKSADEFFNLNRKNSTAHIKLRYEH